jgi:phosphate:Na+ symporter
MELADVLTLFAGLGLFFTGLTLLGEELKRASGPCLRRFLRPLTRRPVTAWAGGVLAGALTSSSKAVTFSLGGLVAASAVPLVEALPIALGGTVGAALIVFWTTFDFELVVLGMLGLAGTLLQFGKKGNDHARVTAGLLLSVGLLFYGLAMVKRGAAPARELEWVRELLMARGESWTLLLGLGAVAATLAQSSSAVSILAIALLGADLLSMQQTVLLVYGANVGSGLSTALLAAGLRGAARQLAVYQAVVRAVPVFLLVPLLRLEAGHAFPGALALAGSISSSPETQVAIIHLLYGLAGSAIAFPVIRRSASVLNRLLPPTVEERFAEVRYVNLIDPTELEGACLLIAQEQLRLAERLPHYLDPMRAEAVQERAHTPETLHAACLSIDRDIRFHLQHALHHVRNGSLADELLRCQQTEDLLTELDSGLFAWGEAGQARDLPAKARALIDDMTEALHTLLLTMLDALTAGDEIDLELFRNMTGDRSELMAHVRQRFIAEDALLPVTGKKVLLDVLLRYEHLVHTMRKALRVSPVSAWSVHTGESHTPGMER